MNTHPKFDKGYDCPKFTVIDGEKRYHQKGDSDSCATCDKYRASFDRKEMGR